MWIPKYARDEKKGVLSPMPTQVVSNEEILPRPIHKRQLQVEELIKEMGEKNAKKHGLDRRSFMKTSMGMATAMLASNAVYGPNWDVQAAEAEDPDASDERFPKGKYLVMDVQAHFTAGMAIGFRNAEFTKNMGFELDGGPDAYSFPNFVKEMYFDSETALLVISGVPGRERDTDRKGKTLEGKDRGGGILPSWLMGDSRDKINQMAGSVRALAQGNCAPNHYWDKAKNAPDFPALYAQMEREVKQYKIASWKWYCHTDPGRSGGGFQIDDDNAQAFMDKSRELGLTTISCHKGFSSQSKTLGHLANPKDIEKAALRNPDFKFIVYHSGLKHGPNEPDYEQMNEFNPETGDFLWHNVLCDIKKRNPDMKNVYAEIGSSFGLTAIEHPIMCQHLMGKNIKYFGADHVIWGTDCLWWGSPQWAIDLFKRFQISDELCEKFGYAKVTDEDRAKIFGLNACGVYGIDPGEKINALKRDDLNKLKETYEASIREDGRQLVDANGNVEPVCCAAGWVRDDTRA